MGPAANARGEKGHLMTESIQTAERPKRGLKWAFVGPSGLRAGWGVALFIAIVVACRFALVAVLHAVHFHAPKSDPSLIDPTSTMFQDGLISAILLIATLLAAQIERRPLAELGLSLKNALPRFIQGLIVGVAAMCAEIGLLLACKGITLGQIVLHGSDIWMFGGQWALAFLLVGVAEELAFRTYLQQTLARGLNFRWSALVMGVLFLAAHAFNAGETPIGLISVFLAALVFTLSVWRTGTVWWAIGFHAAWDWTQSFVFGVADSGHPSVGALMTATPMGPAWLSGGSTGPEGSLLDLAVLLVVAGVIMVTLRTPDQKLDLKW